MLEMEIGARLSLKNQRQDEFLQLLNEGWQLLPPFPRCTDYTERRPTEARGPRHHLETGHEPRHLLL